MYVFRHGIIRYLIAGHAVRRKTRLSTIQIITNTVGDGGASTIPARSTRKPSSDAEKASCFSI
jgi:hypothetical protein